MIGHRAVNNMKGLFGAQMDSMAHPRWGIVDSYDSSTYSMRVRIQPEDILSGWLPILTQVAGSTSILAPPLIGSMVKLVPQEGSEDNYAISGAAFSEVVLPPGAANAIAGNNVPVQPGEVTVIAGSTVFRVSPTGVYVKGNMFVEGDIKSSKEVIDKLGSLDGLRQHYDAHKHTGVQTGSGQTGTTTHPDP